MENKYQLLLRFLNTITIRRLYIAVKLESAWGTLACHRYLQSLLNRDRYEREGFDIETYLLLFQIALLHIQLYGYFDEPMCITVPNTKKMFFDS